MKKTIIKLLVGEEISVKSLKKEMIGHQQEVPEGNFLSEEDLNTIHEAIKAFDKLPR